MEGVLEGVLDGDERVLLPADTHGVTVMVVVLLSVESAFRGEMKSYF